MDRKLFNIVPFIGVSACADTVFKPVILRLSKQPNFVIVIIFSLPKENYDNYNII